MKNKIKALKKLSQQYNKYVKKKNRQRQYI